jgi:hypothetical protein
MAYSFSNSLLAALPALTALLAPRNLKSIRRVTAGQLFLIAVAWIAPTLIVSSTGALANPILMDGDFESPALVSGTYQYGGNCLSPECSSISIAGYGWTFAPLNGTNIASGSGIINATSSSAWFGTSPIPTGFQGNQFGFVQENAAMSQTFIAPITGLYDLTWLEGSRPNICNCYDGNQTYQVSIGSMTFGPYSTLSGQNFELETSGLFSLIGGDSYILTFLGLSTSGDHTVFIDSVSIDLMATPLPAALPPFATGLGALGLLGWRRKRKARIAAGEDRPRGLRSKRGGGARPGSTGLPVGKSAHGWITMASFA